MEEKKGSRKNGCGRGGAYLNFQKEKQFLLWHYSKGSEKQKGKEGGSLSTRGGIGVSFLRTL